MQQITYSLFTYDELSDTAKEKADEYLAAMRGADNYADEELRLEGMFPNSSLKLQYSNLNTDNSVNVYGSLVPEDWQILNLLPEFNDFVAANHAKLPPIRFTKSISLDGQPVRSLKKYDASAYIRTAWVSDASACLSRQKAIYCDAQHGHMLFNIYNTLVKKLEDIEDNILRHARKLQQQVYCINGNMACYANENDIYFFGNGEVAPRIFCEELKKEAKNNDRQE